MTSSDRIDRLFEDVLAGDSEDLRGWSAVFSLRQIGTLEVFERASELCRSGNALARERGAEILGQLGVTTTHPEHAFPEGSYSVLIAMLRHETESGPLASTIAALGHLRNPGAVPLIIPFASHQIFEVRSSVAFALTCFPSEPLIVETLLRLAQDSHPSVREWATIGSGKQRQDH